MHFTTSPTRKRRRFVPRFETLEDRCVLSVLITVDATGNVHLINPNIYGVAYGDATSLADLNIPFNRYGGNNTSRYNWQQNADNRGSDWFFESIGDSSSAPGQRGDAFFSMSKGAGAQADLTIPTIDWVAKIAPNRDKLASFLVSKYGPQQSTDFWFPDAGNGVRPDGSFVTGNDPNDANVPNSVAFEQGWIQHLVNTWGTAASGGVKYYTLDNEPSIWFATHRDVHPVGPTMDEIRDKIIAYASMIKSVDPTAQIIGPEEWGWSGYLYSGYDQQYGSQHGWGYLPDRAAHNNMDYLPYLLDQIHQYDVSHGTHLLDVFSAHYYPQGGEFSDNVSTSMQLLRNRSTRSLWDPNYVDQSWINDKVDLIPRLQGWVNQYDPGLQVGITEYNWGAEKHMNGATTQADILGIFGRQSLDLASRWVVPGTGTPTYNAFKMYRNYDGAKHTFGDKSVSDTVPNPDQVSSFAAARSSDGALTIMVVNKNLYNPASPTARTAITVNLSHFANLGVASRWQLYAPNPKDMSSSVIKHLTDFRFSSNRFTLSVPMQSVTLFVIKPKTTVPAPASQLAPFMGLAAPPVASTVGAPNVAVVTTPAPSDQPAATFVAAAAVTNAAGVPGNSSPGAIPLTAPQTAHTPGFDQLATGLGNLDASDLTAFN